MYAPPFNADSDIVLPKVLSNPMSRAAHLAAIEQWRDQVANTKTVTPFALKSLSEPEPSPSLSPDHHAASPRYKTRLQTRTSSHHHHHPPLLYTVPHSRSSKRQALEELFTGQPPSKRQAMADHDQDQSAPQVQATRGNKGRGRPRGRGLGRGKIQAQEPSLAQPIPNPPHLGSVSVTPLQVPFLPTPSEQSARSPLRSRSTSPRKRNVKSLDQLRSAKTVDLDTLCTCNPAILPLISSEARRRKPMPQAVDALYRQLQELSSGLVPSELKAKYDADANTPMKSKMAPHPSYYLEKGATPFPSETLDRMKARVSLVVEDAAWNHANDAHERQWGKLVAQLVGELEMLPYGSQFRFMNIETCAIEPQEFRPTLPDDSPIPVENGFDDAGSTYSAQASQTMGRMIDWTFGLKLAGEETEDIHQKFKTIPLSANSLNQTLSYPKYHPLFLDIELKRALSPVDPRVQLAVWKSAWLKKMQHHEWDTAMPMPAVTITGHAWEYYLFYPADSNGEQLVMMGPEHFGSTASATGVWEILYRLDVLIRWGIKEYRQWMNDNIMTWARDLP